MARIDIDELDKSLEAAVMLRSSEAGYARDYRNGTAFGRVEDERRLDAFSFGLFDALAERTGNRAQTLALLIYFCALLEQGPGINARRSFEAMWTIGTKPKLGRYVVGGRLHVLRMLSGKKAEAGIFAKLLEQELLLV